MFGWEPRVLLRHHLEQGLSKSAIAERTGISRRTIHHWLATGQLDRDPDAAIRYPPRATKLDTYHDLIRQRLEEAQAAGHFSQRLKTLIFPALLVVDEVLTSNKGFDEWGEIFGDDVMAGALIDRLVHHCHIVNIRGNSFRMRQHADLQQLLSPQPETGSSRSAPRRRPRQEALTS